MICYIINPMTLLIRNVKILGGEGKFPEPADVFISGDKISAIGRFPAKKADEVIDGGGAYLSPGFIDVNTDSDHYLSLLDYPEQGDFLKQGVTTIVGGICGSSLAPLLYGSLESVQKWGDTNRVNVNWHSVREFFATMGKKPIGVNFATFIGHSTIRRAIMGSEIRDLTKNEMEVFGATLRRALDEGGIGLSTGLGYVHSFRAPYAEVRTLVKIAKDNGGAYATHLRKNRTDLLESVDETIRVAQETGVKTIISHFMPQIGAEEAYETALRKIEALPAELDFRFDVYPYDTSVLALYTFLPLWVQSGGREVMLANLRDMWLRPRIEKELPVIDGDHFIVAQAPGNESLVGKTLTDIKSAYGVSDLRAALLKLMLTTELKGIIFYKNINKDLIGRALKSPRSLIASNAASFPDGGPAKILKPERARSTFTEFLSLAISENMMPIEAAIKKITSEPARLLGFAGRGVVKEGNIADLAVFSVGAGEKKAVEMKYTVVNGAIACRSGVCAKTYSGRILKHGA